MRKFDKFKAIIFSDEISKNELVAAVRKIDSSFKNFDEAYASLIYSVDINLEPKDQIQFQKTFAPFLRALAIKHLNEGTTEYANQVRKNYNNIVSSADTTEACDARSIDEFLEKQKKAYVFATELEGGALADILGVSFACTVVNEDYSVLGHRYEVYHSTTENAPMIHLYNLRGKHFFVVEKQPESTFGDGNCLYHGFAQMMRRMIFLEDINKPKKIGLSFFAGHEFDGDKWVLNAGCNYTTTANSVEVGKSAIRKHFKQLFHDNGSYNLNESKNFYQSQPRVNKVRITDPEDPQKTLDFENLARRLQDREEEVEFLLQMKKSVFHNLIAQSKVNRYSSDLVRDQLKSIGGGWCAIISGIGFMILGVAFSPLILSPVLWPIPAVLLSVGVFLIAVGLIQVYCSKLKAEKLYPTSKEALKKCSDSLKRLVVEILNAKETMLEQLKEQANDMMPEEQRMPRSTN